MTISNLAIAKLSASLGSASATARVVDPEARALAKQFLAARKGAHEDALATARNASRHSPEADNARALLQRVYWPRLRSLKVEMGTANNRAKRFESVIETDYANVKRDDIPGTARALIRERAAELADGETFVTAYIDALVRLSRLAVLRNRVSEITDNVGRVALPGAWLDTLTSPLIGTAANRRFMFTGGRDRISDDLDNQDILQEGFLHAIESGDCDENRVPYAGPIYRHIQFARATATRDASLEWSGLRQSLLGKRSLEAAYPDHDDKHVMRLLGTRNYGTRDTHAAAMAEQERENERRTVEKYVTDEARKESLAISSLAYGESFAAQLSAILLDGHTLTEVSEALGLTVETIKSRALSSADSVKSSGIDHEYHEGDAERERDEMFRENAAAERARSAYDLAQRADYIRNRVARFA